MNDEYEQSESRVGRFPSNSIRSREPVKELPSEQPIEDVQAIAKGTMSKPGIMERIIKRSTGGRDIDDVVVDMLSDKVIPSILDAFENFANGLIHAVLFGTDAPKKQQSSSSYSYNRVNRDGYGYSSYSNERVREYRDPPRDLADVTVGSTGEAAEVIRALRSRCRLAGRCELDYLYRLVGIRPVWSTSGLGWIELNENNTGYRSLSNGEVQLVLPPLTRI